MIILPSRVIYFTTQMVCSTIHANLVAFTDDFAWPKSASPVLSTCHVAGLKSGAAKQLRKAVLALSGMVYLLHSNTAQKNRTFFSYNFVL